MREERGACGWMSTRMARLPFAASGTGGLPGGNPPLTGQALETSVGCRAPDTFGVTFSEDL